MENRYALVANALCGGVLLAIIFIASAPSVADSAQEEENRFDFIVEDGRVDASTMRGFQVYTGTCMACHGPDGLGSSFAPSLVQAVQRRSFEDFAASISQGRDFQPGRVMPAFSDDVRVMSHIVDIWNYLGARAEGGLGRGRPRLLEVEAEDTEDAG